MTRKTRAKETGSVHRRHQARFGCPPRQDDGTRPEHACKAPWAATIDAPGTTASGKRRRVTVTASTEKGVERKLRDKRKELEESGATLGSRTTVKQWAEQWLEITQTKLRPSTWRTNRGAVRGYIIPTIGHRRLSELTPADVRAVVKAINAAGLTDSTARRYYATLMPMLKAANLEGHHVPSRVFLTEAPPMGTSDRSDIPIADALKLLEVASEMPHGSRWAAALLNGVRQGEALGLTWEAVDLDARLMTLSWQLQPLTYADRERETFQIPRGFEARRMSGALHLVRPKSKSGWRVIPIVSWLADALERWRLICPDSPHGLVWPRLDGRPMPADDDLAEWHDVQKRAGVTHPNGRPYGTHEARHTTATLLMELGIDPKVITAILGHSSIVVSRGYMHSSKEHERAALEGVAGRLALTPPAAADG